MRTEKIEKEMREFIETVLATCPSLKRPMGEPGAMKVPDGGLYNAFDTAYGAGDDKAAARVFAWLVAEKCRGLRAECRAPMYVAAMAALEAWTLLVQFEANMEWSALSPNMKTTNRALTEAFVSRLLTMDRPGEDDVRHCLYFFGRGGDQEAVDAFASLIKTHGVRAETRELIERSDCPAEIRALAKSAPPPAA